MSCNFIHIELKNKNYKYKEKMLELFKSSIGIGKINHNYSYISIKYALSNKIIFKLKDDPSRGYINQPHEISYNKKFIKKNNAKMIYKANESNKDIKIFNQKFISNNMKRAKVFINNKQYDLKENIESEINKIKIKFVDNIIYLNSMFKYCKSLSSVLLNLDTKYLKTIHYLFYGCNSLSCIKDISFIWNIDYIKNYFNDYNDYISLFFFKLKKIAFNIFKKR